MFKRYVTNCLLFFYWTFLVAYMVAISPIVVVYALLFDPDE